MIPCVRVIQNKKNRTLNLDEENYLTTMLHRIRIRAGKYKSKKIPIADYESLYSANEQDELIDFSEYYQEIRSLAYIIVFISLDIVCIFGKLGQLMSNQAKYHTHALKNHL
jgi:hypothetical protein